MANTPALTEWGFVPPPDPAKPKHQRPRHPFTLVDEDGREVTATDPPEGGADDDVVTPRTPVPWVTITVAALTAACAIAAFAAAWVRVPPLADTPTLEAAPPSDEPSEIWAEAEDQGALARGRAALSRSDAAPAASSVRIVQPNEPDLRSDETPSDNPY